MFRSGNIRVTKEYTVSVEGMEGGVTSGMAQEWGPEPESLADKVYLQLRQGIILGQYPQGMRLAEQRLATTLDVSRVPLREALLRLENDGFITSLPRRSAQVVTWTRQMVDDLFDARLAIEVKAAGDAAARVASPQDVAPLRATLAAIESAVAKSDDLAAATLSALFHVQLVALTGNAILEALNRSISGRVTWLFYMTSSLDQHEADQEHYQVLDAIANRNVRLAEAACWAHIERVRQPSLAQLGLV
jgi:DNA-binding GntR family transcriptional regulator